MSYRLISIALAAVLLLLVYSWSARVVSTPLTPANRLPAVEFDTFIAQKSSPPIRSFSRISPPGTYTSGDTVTEVKYGNDPNTICESRRVEKTEEEWYREFYLDTETLKEEGAFRHGRYIGVRKFYAPDGSLEKELDYTKGTKKLYGKSSEPYDDVFRFIRKRGQAVLARYFDSEFIDRYLVLDPGGSRYYGNDAYSREDRSGSWFEVPDYEPSEFLLRYNIVLQDTVRSEIIEFRLDRQGRLKRGEETDGLLYSKGRKLAINPATAERIALRNGLSEGDKPFSYHFSTEGDVAQQRRRKRLEFVVTGSPDPDHGSPTEPKFGDKDFVSVVIDPWTGKFLRTEYFRLVHTKCDRP